MKGIPSPENITTADLILAVNQALLCLIHPNMRQIDVEYIREERVLKLYVFFDSKPTDEQVDDVGNMITEIFCQFPEITCEDHVIVLPYPMRIPDKGICVYRRYEPSPDSDN